jgi:hypothetical protein
LLLLRSLTAIYMTFVIALSIHYEIKHRHNGELYVFNASHLSYFMQALYYWITSVSHTSLRDATRTDRGDFSSGPSSIFYGLAIESLKDAMAFWTT